MLPERTLKKDVYVWHVGTELTITVVARSNALTAAALRPT